LIEEFIGNNTQNEEVWQASSSDITGGFELVIFLRCAQAAYNFRRAIWLAMWQQLKE
jgi:hypothetical protein